MKKYNIDEILHELNNGKTLKSIGDKYKVSGQTIKYKLKKHNKQLSDRRVIGSNRKHKINLSFFYIISQKKL